MSCRQESSDKLHFSTRLTLILGLTISLLMILTLPLRAQETIDPRTGWLSVTERDLVVEAGPLHLEVRRILELQGAEAGLFGSRWRLNWETRLRREGNVVWIQENGAQVQFDHEGSGTRYKSVFGERVLFQNSGLAIRTKLDGIKEMFDAQGRLTERTVRNGNRIILKYNEGGQLTRIEGPKGSFLEFKADNHGRIIQVKAWTGANVQYNYADENLTQVQVNGGPPIRYVYDARGALILIDDPRSGLLNFSYDSKGRVLSRRWADGSQERYEYDDERNIRRHINAGGGITTSRWSSDYRQGEITDPLGNKTTLEYDNAGRLAKVTGPTGAVAEITYDSLSRTVAVKDPQGHITRFEYLGESSLVKSVTRPDCTPQVFEYDEKGNLARMLTGTTTVAAYTYSQDGLLESARGLGIQETTFAYYPDARLKEETNVLGETTRFEYDTRGNLTRQINPLGGEKLWQYDAQDRMVSETDPVGRTTRYKYDTQGQLVQVIDGMAGVTRYSYDERGRMVMETDPAGRTTRYEYDRTGRLSSIVAPGNSTERFRYDVAGNLREWIDRLGRVTTYHYSPLGRLVTEKQPSGLELRYRYDALGNLLGISDTAGVKSEYQRNVCGRLDAKINPLGAITRYQYDPLGNLIAAIDPRSQVKRFSYTPEGQVLTVREPSGDEGGFEYDLVGRLGAIHRPSGGVMRFTYDAMGNLTGKIDPAGNQRAYGYDLAGRRTRITDATGKVTTFLYDEMDRVTGERLPDGRDINYHYNARGDLIQVDDGSFPLRYRYDPDGRLTRTEYSAIQKPVAYEYNELGLRKKLIGPEGRETSYEYNDLKQLAAVVLPDGKRIAFTYDIKGRLQSTRYPNGIAGVREYDLADRITALRYQAPDGKTVFGWTYRYDATGNLAEQRDHQGRTTRFQYDPAGQVTEERAAGYRIRYRYLPAGNRTQVEEDGTVTTYRYDIADRLIQRGPEQLTYDQNGRLTARNSAGRKTRYEYDSKDRLVKVVTPDGGITSYGYSPTGERVWKRDKDGLTYYLYDGMDLIHEAGEAGRMKATYIHGPGLDRPLAMIREGRTYYYHADRLGSIRHLTDERGVIVASYDYDAFGNLKNQEPPLPNPFTFTAREFDRSTGLYYYRARYYDPTLGRFLTEDPISAEMDEPLDQNPYLYAMNNPVRFTDPLGLNRYSSSRPLTTAGPVAITEPAIPTTLPGIPPTLDAPGPPAPRPGGTISQYPPGIDPWRIPPWEIKRGLGGSRQDWLEYLRLLEKRPGQRDFARHWIRHLEQSSGPGAIPGTPSVSSSSTPPAPRPGRPGVIPGRPGVSSSSMPPTPKGGVSPKNIGGGTVGVIGLLSAYFNYQACIDEGNSGAWCHAEWIGGLVVGGAAAAAAVALGVPTAIIAGVGAVVVAGGAVLTGDRWVKAFETRAEQEQEAARQKQEEERIKSVLAGLDGKIAALEEKGKWVREALGESLKNAVASSKVAKDALNNLKTLEKMSSQVTDQLNKECIKYQEWLKGLRKSAVWAKNAKTGFQASEYMLNRCQSLQDVKDADDFFDAAKKVAQSAKRKYESAQSGSASARETFSRMKETSKSIRDNVNRAKERYLGNVKSLDELVKATKEWAKTAQDRFKEFETQKDKLLTRVNNLRGVWPRKYSADLNAKETKIRGMPPRQVDELKNYIKQAEDAQSSASPGLSTSLTFLSQGINLTLVESTLSSCGQLGSPDKELGKAGQALSEMGDVEHWLRKLGKNRSTCVAKLDDKTKVATTPPPKTPTEPSGGHTPPTTTKTPPTTTTQTPPIQPPPGGLDVVGWGISPSSATMSEGGSYPRYTFSVAYMDYSDPTNRRTDHGVNANFKFPSSPKAGKTYTVTAEYNDPVTGKLLKGNAKLIVKKKKSPQEPKKDDDTGSPFDVAYTNFTDKHGERETERPPSTPDSSGTRPPGYGRDTLGLDEGQRDGEQEPGPKDESPPPAGGDTTKTPAEVAQEPPSNPEEEKPPTSSKKDEESPATDKEGEEPPATADTGKTPPAPEKLPETPTTQAGPSGCWKATFECMNGTKYNLLWKVTTSKNPTYFDIKYTNLSRPAYSGDLYLTIDKDMKGGYYLHRDILCGGVFLTDVWLQETGNRLSGRKKHMVRDVWVKVEAERTSESECASIK